MIKEFEICAYCRAPWYQKHPDSDKQTQTFFYECGNSITCTFGEQNAITLQEEHGGCNNKVEWEKILIPYGEEFDNSAKLIDDRFFGWVELQFYKTYHQEGWINRNQGKVCTDSEFLDKYFENKEFYLRDLRKINESILYIKPLEQVIKKDYTGDFYIGEVLVQEINKSTVAGIEHILYKIVSSEEDLNLIGSYIEERNQVGGGDNGITLYEREVLDIIFRNEKKS